MRAAALLLGLVMALLIVSLLVRQQLTANGRPTPAMLEPRPGQPDTPPAALGRDARQEVQQSYQEALDAAMQQRRSALGEDD